MRKIGILVAAVALCAFFLAGCASGTGETNATQGSGSTPAEDSVKIDEIDWTVEPGLDGSQCRVMFSCTNNSEYDIVGVELHMVMRDDATDDEIASAFDYIIERGSTIEEIRDSSFSGEVTMLIHPGETSNAETCDVAGYYVNNIEQYELMQPDFMVIQFLSDGKLYEESYDFTTSSYSLSSEVIDTTQWLDDELFSLLPKPENELIVSVHSSPTRASFDTICTTNDGFLSYVAACKEMGYTGSAEQSDSSYSADSEDGQYEIDVTLFDGDMSVYLSPKEEAAPEPEAPAATDPAPATDASGVSADFKATMDDYEAFFDEYVAFMQEYSSGSMSADMLSSYSDMMARYSEAMASLSAVDTSTLSAADAAYYTEVMARISAKVAGVGM